MGQEKRVYKRYDTDIEIHFWEEQREDNTESAYLGTCCNCSLGGLYLTSEILFTQNKLFNLRFDVINSEEQVETIKVKAIIAWIKDWTEPYGIGMKFISFRGESRKTYEEWIKKLESESSQEN